MTGGAPIERLVDVCPTCAPPIVELHELLRRLPNNLGGAPRQTNVGERMACSVCGDEVAQSHLSSHIVKKHGVHLPQPPQCPDCDRPYKPSMMLKHRASAHGYDHAAALIATLEASPKRTRGR